MMKVYVYFLSPPDKPYGRYTERKIESFNSVLQIFEDRYYKNKEGAMVEINGNIRYLYAFTNDSVLAEDFEFIHDMNLFTKIERKMDKEEYKEFHKVMEYAELGYKNMEDDSSLLLTKLENHVLSTAIDDVELYLSEFSCLGYEMFKDEYIHALDILLYTLFYQLAGAEADFYGANYGYGLTPEGSPSGQISLALNSKTMYVQMFSLILK